MVTHIVVDSNVIIDYLRIGNETLINLLNDVEKGLVQLYCPSIIILELYSGQSSKVQNEEIIKILNAFIVVGLDRDLAKIAGELRRDNKPTVSVADSIFAATALSLNAQLATNNLKHFSFHFSKQARG